MSDESTAPEANEQTNPTPSSKPSLEDAFAGEDGKSRLASNFVRPKKLGISQAAEGENDLSGRSKKSKSPFNKAKKDEPKAKAKPLESADSSEEEEQTLFDAPEPEKEEKPAPAATEDEEAEQDEEIEAKEDKPEAALPKKHKVKINGQEMEVTEEELIRGYQIRKASEQKFLEADKLHKQNQALISKAKDPQGLLELIQAFGHDPRQLSEQYLYNQLQFEMMTPEQKRIHQLEYEKAQRDRELQQAIEKHRAETAERESKARADAMQKTIIETMEKNADLPRDSGTIRRIIEHMRTRIKAQAHLPEDLREDVTPASVLDDVRASIEKDLRTKASQMTPEQLAKYLGNEKIDELRKWQVSQIKNPMSAKVAPQNNTPEKPRQKKRHFKTMEEFRANQVANGIKTFGGRF